MDYQYIFNKTQFPNDKFNISLLDSQIRSSDITISLARVDSSDSESCLTIFRAELPDADEDILNLIVSTHNGEMERNPELVKIAEEDYKAAEVATQGHFQSTVIDIETTGDEVVEKDISFPYPVSLFSAEWLVDAEHKGDRSEFHIAPNTIVGAIIAPVDISSNEFSVSPTVLENMQLGYHIKIGSSDDLGRVSKIDLVNKTISVENPVSEAFDAGEYVKMTIKVVDYWRFTATGFNSVGESKIGASYIPPNTILRMVYYNENEIMTKKIFGISIDYMY